MGECAGQYKLSRRSNEERCNYLKVIDQTISVKLELFIHGLILIRLLVFFTKVSDHDHVAHFFNKCDFSLLKKLLWIFLLVVQFCRV